MKSRKDMATRASDHSHTTILTQLQIWIHVINSPPDFAVMPLNTLCYGMLLNAYRLISFLRPSAQVSCELGPCYQLNSKKRTCWSTWPISVQDQRFIVGSTMVRNSNRSLMLQKAKAGDQYAPKMRALASQGDATVVAAQMYTKAQALFSILIYHHETSHWNKSLPNSRDCLKYLNFVVKTL